MPNEKAPHGWSYQVDSVAPEKFKSTFPTRTWIVHNVPDLLPVGQDIEPIDPVTREPHGFMAVVVERWPSAGPDMPVEYWSTPATRRKRKGKKNAPRD